jgi:hypothetical protein
MFNTPSGTFHVKTFELVKRSTMYLVPVEVPLMVSGLPENELRPPDDVKVFEIVTFPDDAEAFVFPAASLKEPAVTVTVPVPLEVV